MTVRAFVLAGTVVTLVALTLLASRVGPWVSRPIATRPVVLPPPPTRTASVPPVLPAAAGTGQSAGRSWSVALLVVGVIVAGVLAILLLRALLRALRGVRGAEAVAVPALSPPAVGPQFAAPDGIGVGVGVSDGRTFDSRAAANSIIAVWARIEDAARDEGCGRRPASTPTEFLEELLAHGAPMMRSGEPAVAAARRTVDAGHTVLALYHRARFDHSTLAPDAAARAAAAADLVLAGLAALPGADPRSVGPDSGGRDGDPAGRAVDPGHGPAVPAHGAGGAAPEDP